MNREELLKTPDSNEDTPESLVHVAAKMLGQKLLNCVYMQDDVAAKQLNQIAKELRETLISLGLRKRKTRKTSEEKAAAKILLEQKAARKKVIDEAIAKFDATIQTKKGRK